MFSYVSSFDEYKQKRRELERREVSRGLTNYVTRMVSASLSASVAVFLGARLMFGLYMSTVTMVGFTALLAVSTLVGSVRNFRAMKYREELRAAVH